MAQRGDMDGVVVELPPDQYEHYLRMLTQMTPEEALGVAGSTGDHLAYLGVKRDLSKAKLSPFAGSVSVDVQTFLAWVRKVQSRRYHRRALKQLIALDATACVRGGGNK